MTSASTSLRSIAAAVAVAFLPGCTIGSSSQSPQSHFAFPNSNVIPVGESSGSHSRLCGLLIFNWGSPSADDQEQATKEALERSKADILINVRTDSAQQIIPLLFNVCVVKVRGTAAKMEVGRQQLSAVNTGGGAPPPPPPLPPPPAPSPSGCTRDTDCTGDRLCSQGRCGPPPVPPQGTAGCTSDNDCKAGRQCRDGNCVSRP